MLDFQEVCSRFRVSRQGQDTAQAYCPVHAGGDEKNPSLTISRGADGRTLIYCHVCGKEGTKAILDAAGLKPSDIQPEGKRRGKSLKDFAEWPGKDGRLRGARFVASYDYANERGYAYTKCRVALPDGGKTFRYCRTDLEGNVAEFKVKNRQQYGALYPFRCLQAARDGSGIVLYTEGEKDADNAVKDGFQAVTAGGSNDWTADLTKHFEGLRVYVVPDNDEPGFKSACKVADDLDAQGIAARVIVWPDGFQQKGDYSDYIESFADRVEGKYNFGLLMESAVTPERFHQVAEERLKQFTESSRAEAAHVTEDEVQAVAKQIRDIEGGKVFAVTDLKNGELIGRLFPKCRYNTTAKSWFYFDGRRWTLDAEGMHVERATAVYAEALLYYSMFFMDSGITPDDLTAFRKACGTLTKRQRRVAAIQDARKVRAFSSEDLDTDTALFNCLNGVLNLDTGEFTEHSPDYLISKVAGCEYRPEANRQDFARFVDQVMQGDADKIAFLQTFMGYALRGNPVEEGLLIEFGASSRNGKGTANETFRACFGDYGASIRPESLAVKKNRDGSAASGDIARLAGVRFLNCSEPAKGLHLDEALVKTLTGGDKITARHLYEREFEYYPQFSLVMNTNYLPTVTDTTLFTSGRVMVLTFEKHFSEEEQDKGLKARLREPENLSAVLNWMLEGLRRYRKEGLRRPESVLAATADYADESDKLKRFFADELEEAPGVVLKGSDVYERFTSWCKASGLYAESKPNFFQLLRGRNLLRDKGTVGGKTCRNVVKGYMLTAQSDETKGGGSGDWWG